MPRKEPTDPLNDIPHVRQEPRPDFSQPPAAEKLNENLQRILEREDTLFEEIYEGTAPDTTDSSLRYAAYATRIRTILLSAHRYVAYTSDIGESFRPVAHPYLVKGAYGISWAYLAGDVLHEGYKAYWRNQRLLNPTITPEDDGTTSQVIPATSSSLPHPNRVAQRQQQQQPADAVIVSSPAAAAATAPRTIPALDDYRTVMAERAVFQSIASMGLPAFTIHSIVRYSGRALKNAKTTAIRTYLPIGLGLATVPFLPYLFDHPVEQAVEYTFYKAFLTLGGPSAVVDRGHADSIIHTPRKDRLDHENRLARAREKEMKIKEL